MASPPRGTEPPPGVTVEAWRRRNYYAVCNEHLPGSCRGCGGDLAPRRSYYCADDECRSGFESDHFWGTARAAAVARATVYRLDGTRVGAVCARCGRFPIVPEVNHVDPVDGNRDHFSCANHLGNLEVLCHECHLAVTAEQRASGLIGARGPLVLVVAVERWRTAERRVEAILACGHAVAIAWERTRRETTRVRCRECG